MVLLQNRRWEPLPEDLPAGLRPDDEVWRAPLTGQTFTDFEAYLEHVKTLASRQWSSNFTGIGNLTYEEALVEDQKGLRLAQEFPTELEDRLVPALHHSTLPLDDVVDRIYNQCRSTPADEDDVAGAGPGHCNFHRSVLRAWLFKVADLEDRGTYVLWRVKEPYRQAYNLPEDAVLPIVENGPPSSSAKSKGKRAAGGAPARHARKKSNVGDDGDEALTDSPGDEDNGNAPAMSWDAADIPQDMQLPTLEEEEARFQPGTAKFAAFQVLKAAGRRGLSLPQITTAANAAGLKNWGEHTKKILQLALSSDAAFVRTDKGTYALGVLLRGAPPPRARKAKGPRAPRMPKSLVANHAQHSAEASGSFPPWESPSEAFPGGGAAGDEGEGSQPELLDTMYSSQDWYPDTQPLSAEEQDDLNHAEADTSAQAEAQAATARTDLAAALARLAGAQEAAALLAEQKRAALARARMPKKRRGEEGGDPGPSPDAAPPSFEVAPEELEFRGDPNNRKDVMAHRKRVQALTEDKEAEREAWLRKQRSARERGRTSKEVVAIAKLAQQANADVAAAQAAAAAAEACLADAEMALNRERGREAAAGRRAAERSARREAEWADRERRRAEAAHARRYPMDDTALREELAAAAAKGGADPGPEDVPTPSCVSAEEADGTLAALYVVDFVQHFGRQLGCATPPWAEVQALLAGAHTGQALAARSEAHVPVWDLYQGLLRFLLANSSKRVERRWGGLLGPDTWPEILRRVLLLRGATGAGVRGMLMSSQAAYSADVLAGAGPEALAPGAHCALLQWMCDECCDCECLRAVLAQRLGAADSAKRTAREVLGEEKGRLKAAPRRRNSGSCGQELLEAERSERRARASDVRRCDDDDAPALPDPYAFADFSRAAEGSEAGFESEEEPCWELPEELREYEGDPGDRKSTVAFKQAQQAARAQLDAERTRWAAERRRRAKARDSERRARADAERSKSRDRTQAQEAIQQRQEECERELERCAVRRAPLGLDRRHRRYWWGMAGERAGVWVEGGPGALGLLTAPAELDALLATLDVRGVRELGLHEGLHKAYASITLAMRRASNGGDRSSEGATERSLPRLGPRSSRRAAAAAGDIAPNADLPVQPAPQPVDLAIDVGLPGLEGYAAASTVSRMLDLQAASTSGMLIAPPEAPGWPEWGAAVVADAQAAQHTHGIPAPEDGLDANMWEEATSGALKGVLRRRILELEDTLFTATGATPESEEQQAAAAAAAAAASAAATAVENGEGSPTAGPGAEGRRERPSGEAPGPGAGVDLEALEDQELGGRGGSSTRVWHSMKQRNWWKGEVNQAGTLAHLAFCTHLLAANATPFLTAAAERVALAEQVLAEEAAASRRTSAAARAAKKRPPGGPPCGSEGLDADGLDDGGFANGRSMRAKRPVVTRF